MITRYLNIIKFIAANYRRRCPWVADVRDLEQEGAAAVIRVLHQKRSFDGVGGERAYAVRAAVLAIRERAWRDFYPVSVRRCPGAIHLARYAKARLRRAPVEDARTMRAFDSPEEQLATAQMRRLVMRAVFRLADEHPDCVPGLLALHGDRKAADVARSLDIPVVQVYRSTAKVRDRLGRDAELRAVWQEMAPVA